MKNKEIRSSYVHFRRARLLSQDDAQLLLFDASRRNSVDDAAAALLGGALLDRENSLGFSPLSIAAFNGGMEVFSFLLEEGANVHSSFGSAPLVPLIVSGRGYMALSVLERSPELLNEKSQFGMTALLAAIRVGDEALARLFFGMGALFVWKGARQGELGVLDCLPSFPLPTEEYP